jgi:hypothetical protein
MQHWQDKFITKIKYYVLRLNKLSTPRWTYIHFDPHYVNSIARLSVHHNVTITSSVNEYRRILRVLLFYVTNLPWGILKTLKCPYEIQNDIIINNFLKIKNIM